MIFTYSSSAKFTNCGFAYSIKHTMSIKYQFETNYNQIVTSLWTPEQTPNFYEIHFNLTDPSFPPPPQTAISGKILIFSRKGDTESLEYQAHYEIDDWFNMLNNIPIDEDSQSGSETLPTVLLVTIVAAIVIIIVLVSIIIWWKRRSPVVIEQITMTENLTEE
jgi:hypothetical protein